MKRTTEIILTSIGLAIHVIGLLVIGIALIGDYIYPNENNDGTVLVTVIYVLTIVCLILAIIAISKLNKNNKLSGILLITTGVLVVIPNVISSILWIISGIMLLVRKEAIPNYKINSNYKSVNTNIDKNSINNDPFEKSKPEPDESVDLKKEEIEDPFKY